VKNLAQVLVRSVAVEMDMSQISLTSVLWVSVRLGKCENSNLEYLHEIYVDKGNQPIKIGFGMSTIIIFQNDGGERRKGEIPKSLLEENAQFAEKVEQLTFSLKPRYEAFLKQKLQKDSKPIYIHPLVIRYSDEDGNHHVNSTVYFKLFNDAKLSAAIKGSKRRQKDDENVHPDIVELSSFQADAFYISYLREVKVTDPKNFYIIVQANIKERILEFFLAAEEPKIHQERIHTIGRMEISSKHRVFQSEL